MNFCRKFLNAGPEKNARLPKRRHFHSRTGATTFLLAGFSFVAGLIGLFVIMLALFLGGNRQAQHATDAGALNLVKQVIVGVGVPLTSQEREEFGDLVDTNGLITLRTYNRVVGRAMLIAINAQEEGTPEALGHAREVLSMAQSGTQSIGKRLRDLLVDPQLNKPAFESVAQANSCRMLGNNALLHLSSETSYLQQGEASNIYLDEKQLSSTQRQRIESLGILIDQNNEQMFKGYTTIDLGDGFVFSFVPLAPGQAPHLVSRQEFERNRSMPGNLPSSVAEHIPPNAFMVNSSINESSGQKVMTSACGVPGALDKLYPASVPSGYIKIVNPKGFESSSVTPSLTNFYTGVGMTGVYLITGQSGIIAFSADPEIAQRWAAYNADSSGPQPPLTDADGNSLVYDSNGEPASMFVLHQITGSAAPLTGCNTLNVGGPSADPVCAQMLPAFERAYPSDPPTNSGTTTELIAVEKFQDNIIQAWNLAVATGIYHGDGCMDIYPPSGPSGLRLFDHDRTYTNDWNNKWTTPGTVPQLLNQVSHAARKDVLVELNSRIREIKPEATDAEIAALLDSKTLELSTTHYLYMADDKSRSLTLSAVPPKTMVSEVTADGTLKVYSSGQYPTLYKSTNTWASWGANIPWWVPPNPLVAGLGTDRAFWTPSSGYKNLLGQLSFTNECTGGGSFCNAN